MARRIYAELQALMAGSERWLDANLNIVASADISESDELICFVNGLDVTILEAVLPVRAEAEARSAAPYAIEDDIAAPIEDIHVALGPVGTSMQDPRSVHVASTERMSEWRQWIDAHPKFSHARLIAEQSVLPEDTIIAGPERYLVNLAGRAFCIDRSMPLSYFEDLFQGYDLEPPGEADILAQLVELAEASETRLDLRQGAYKAYKRLNLNGLSKWRLNAGLAASFAVIWCLSVFLETQTLQSETRQLREDMRIAYTSVFSEPPRSGDYVRAVRQAVTDMGPGQALTFREASTALYRALDKVPDSELQSIRYDATQGGLSARIAYLSYGYDAQLKDALLEIGVRSEIGDARQQGQFVVGDVRLQGVVQ